MAVAIQSYKKIWIASLPSAPRNDALKRFLTSASDNARMGIEVKIAAAIKKADNSYFSEDYTKQARSVLSMLDSEGFAIVPKTTSEEMVTAGVDAIAGGKVRPSDHVKQVYEAIIKAAKIK